MVGKVHKIPGVRKLKREKHLDEVIEDIVLFVFGMLKRELDYKESDDSRKSQLFSFSLVGIRPQDTRSGYNTIYDP